MPTLELLAEVSILESKLDICRHYCRNYLQDEAEDWAKQGDNDPQVKAVREMFDALGLPYRVR